jgi:Flp pilus assembly protein TadD
LDKAVPEFREALRLRPQFAGAHYNLGLVYQKQNRKDDAAREFRQVLALDPQFRPAREALLKLEKDSDH